MAPFPSCTRVLSFGCRLRCNLFNNEDQLTTVAFNCLILREPYTGVAYSIHRMVDAVAAADSQRKYKVLVPSGFRREFKSGNIEPVRSTLVGGRSAGLRVLYEQLVLPMTVHKLRADLLHFPAWVAPRLIRVPYVLTVHDLIPYLLPIFCKAGTVRHFKNMMPRSVAGAARILVPSEQVKSELLTVFEDTEPSSVVVIPFAPVHQEFQGSRDAAVRKLAESYGITSPFFLCVGNIEPRKNLGHLLRAFFAARMKSKFEHKLVIVGRKAWKANLVDRVIASHGMQEMVHMVGYVKEDDISAFYAAATAFCFPSIAEGFGLPLVEALASGCPCLVSDIPVFHELAGDQATYLPMADLSPWREAIEQAIAATPSSQAVRARKQRAAKFSWAETARRTIAVYSEVERELGLE